MRPTRLELEGFTAFREKSVIDFTRLDLFAITGPTGAGKTSILDAITYALYGRTARLSKAGRDLMSQGSNAMSVVFEFNVGLKSYRAARTIRGTSATVRLEALENGTWKPNSGRATDMNAEIERLIGLDFSGFTKTVILPQGRFDVFLRGDPKERREVLTDLLDVKIYARMMSAANAKAKDAGVRGEERARSIDPDATPEAKSLAESELADLADTRASLEKRASTLRGVLTDALVLRERRRALRASESEQASSIESAGRIRNSIAAATSTAEREAEAARLLSERLAAISYDADQHVRLSALRPKAEQLERVAAGLGAEQSRLMKSTGQLAQATRRTEDTESECARAAASLEAAESAARDAEVMAAALRGEFGSADKIRLLLDEIGRAEGELPAIERDEQEIRQLVARGESLEAETGSAADQLEQAQAKLARNEQTFAHLEAIDKGAALRLQLERGEPCPVCAQTVHELPPKPDAAELTEARSRVKGAKLAVERASQKLNSLQNEASQIPDRIDQKRQLLDGRRKRIAELERRLPGGGLIAARPLLAAAAEKSIAAEQTAAAARQQLDAARAQHNAAQPALQQARHQREMIEAEIRRAAQRISELEREREQLAEELGEHTDAAAMARAIHLLEAALKERREIESRWKQHDEARRRAEADVESKRGELAALDSAIHKLDSVIEAGREETARMESALRESVPGLATTGDQDEAGQIEALERSARRDLDNLRLDIQRREIAIADLASRIERNAKLREEVESLRTEAAIQHDLSVWLNGSNFQQYLLGSAYGILTREGSRHLSQLSGGRYGLVFEDDEFAVRDHANAGDTRSVKTLSGGESFLASLSLALALAESITQLNGTRGAVNLESLFLDEGFSTLDMDTLGKVADALEVLHGGHRMVGIITHIVALAEQMPARIEVVKSASGSRVEQDSGGAVRTAGSGFTA